MKRSRFLTLSALYLATHSAMADDAMQKSAAQVTQAAALNREDSAAAQLAGEFAALLGSTESAGKLIDGLRSGSPVSLTSNSPNDTATLIASPRPLTLQEVHAALSLAQAQLKAKGVVNPAPTAYLRSSLIGGLLPNAHGDMTRVVGILPLHQRGMKWEQIARALRVEQPRPWSAAPAGNGERES